MMDRDIRRWMKLCESVDTYDLRTKYAHYNHLLFDGILPDIPISWKKMKGAGGMVYFQKRLTNRPPPNPMMVRLGRVDKYANWDVVPESITLYLSPIFKKSEQVLDGLLIHEMIHVWFATNEMMGEGHGVKFLEQVRRCSKVVGFVVPLRDNVAGLELSEPDKVKSYGVVLIAVKDGTYAYAMVSAALLRADLDAFKAKFSYYGKYHKGVSFWVIADAMWTLKGQQSTIQRTSNPGMRKITEPDLVDDLKKNGELLAEITS